MFELLVTALFIWFFVKAIGFSAKLAWGAARVAGSVLFVLALPVLVWCLLFAGGLVLLLPLLMVGAACGILRSR